MLKSLTFCDYDRTMKTIASSQESAAKCISGHQQMRATGLWPSSVCIHYLYEMALVVAGAREGSSHVSFLASFPRAGKALRLWGPERNELNGSGAVFEHGGQGGLDWRKIRGRGAGARHI